VVCSRAQRPIRLSRAIRGPAPAAGQLPGRREAGRYERGTAMVPLCLEAADEKTSSYFAGGEKICASDERQVRCPLLWHRRIPQATSWRSSTIWSARSSPSTGTAGEGDAAPMRCSTAADARARTPEGAGARVKKFDPWTKIRSKPASGDARGSRPLSSPGNRSASENARLMIGRTLLATRARRGRQRRTPTSWNAGQRQRGHTFARSARFALISVRHQHLMNRPRASIAVTHRAEAR